MYHKMFYHLKNCGCKIVRIKFSKKKKQLSCTFYNVFSEITVSTGIADSEQMSTLSIVDACCQRRNSTFLYIKTKNEFKIMIFVFQTELVSVRSLVF